MVEEISTISPSNPEVLVTTDPGTISEEILKLPENKPNTIPQETKLEYTIPEGMAEEIRKNLTELRNRYLHPDEFLKELNNYSDNEKYLIWKTLTSSEVQNDQNPFVYDKDYRFRFGDLAGTPEEKALFGKYQTGVLIEPSLPENVGETSGFDEKYEEIVKEILLGGNSEDSSKKDQYLMSPVLFLILNHKKVLGMEKAQVEYIIDQMQKFADKKGLVLYEPETPKKVELELLANRKMDIMMEPPDPVLIPPEWSKSHPESLAHHNYDRARVDFNTHMTLKTILAGDIGVRESGSTEWKRRVR